MAANVILQIASVQLSGTPSQAGFCVKMFVNARYYVIDKTVKSDYFGELLFGDPSCISRTLF